MIHKIIKIMSVGIIAGMLLIGYNYANDFVSGKLEIEWVVEGLCFTNLNLRFIFLLGLTGYGVVWLSEKFLINASVRMMLSCFLIILMAAFMAMSESLLYVIPFFVFFVVLTYMVKQRDHSVKTIFQKFISSFKEG